MHALLDLAFHTQFSYVSRCLPLGFSTLLRIYSSKDSKTGEIVRREKYRCQFRLRDRSSGDDSRKREVKRGRRGNGASPPPVICNSQVGRAERCEIPGRFSGEEQARRTKRTRRCLSGLFANDVPMSRVTLTRRHLEPAAMNFSSNVFPRATPFRSAIRSIRETREGIPAYRRCLSSFYFSIVEIA